MDMEKENGDVFGTKYTFGLVIRGDITDINSLISFLKASNLTVVHQQMGTKKMYIEED